ncbi:MAG: hypothetical protein IJ244_06615 [Bacteroidaceae bacterium]|nr:hypothetical protein [Bacteroidaceae bacterium]
MKKHILSAILLVAMAISAKAQMGYQVALLNKANGKPRANVTVNAQVSITNAKDETIFSSTQQATSNDFGILSLTVGDANTFKNADFGKLPFFISVTVDGTLVSKSQILSVPVAEAAKTLVPGISLDELCSKEWPFCNTPYTAYRFYKNGTCFYITNEESYAAHYEIIGTNIYVYRIDKYDGYVLRIGRFFNGQIYWS